MNNYTKYILIICCFLMGIQGLNAQKLKTIFQAENLKGSEKLTRNVMSLCERCWDLKHKGKKRAYKKNKCADIEGYCNLAKDAIYTPEDYFIVTGISDTMSNESKVISFNYVNNAETRQDVTIDIEVFDANRNVIYSNSGRSFDVFLFDKKNQFKVKKMRLNKLKLKRRYRVIFLSSMSIPKRFKEGAGIVKITIMARRRDDSSRKEVLQTITQNIYLKKK